MTVDENRTVELALDRAAALDEHLVNHLPLGAGLDRDEGLIEESLGDPRRVVGALGQFHAALRRALHHPLASATGMDLGFDGADRRAEGRERSSGFVGGASHFACQHRHAGGPEEFLGLVFVDLHAGLPSQGGRGRSLPGEPTLSHTAPVFPIDRRSRHGRGGFGGASQASRRVIRDRWRSTRPGS